MERLLPDIAEVLLLVMILESPDELEGRIVTWLFGAQDWIFLVTQRRVRDELWNKRNKEDKESGSVIQICNDKNSQGFLTTI